MSEYDMQNMKHPHNDHDHAGSSNTILETDIIRALHEQATKVHFTPAMHARVMQQLSPRRVRSTPSKRLVLAFSLAVALLLIIALATTVVLSLQPPHPPVIATVNYVMNKTLMTPAELAQGGQLLSLDPTDQHIVYEPAHQAGVMYTADLADPVTSNLLAMQNARDVTWAPDGSALVTTIYPDGVFQPLLALVPIDKFMHKLGYDALAASWSPTSTQDITFVTLTNGHIHLWSTGPDGKSLHDLATMNISQLVQRLAWSHDGHKLALVATTGSTPSQQALQQPGRAIYVMDARTNSLQLLVAPGDFTIGNVGWSPDSRYFTYEQIDTQENITLHAIDVTQRQSIFAIPLHHTLTGWSWSPDSRALVYSDGGVLRTHIVHGATIQLPSMQGVQNYPFWLKDGRILYMHITQGVGTLTFLAQRT